MSQNCYGESVVINLYKTVVLCTHTNDPICNIYKCRQLLTMYLLYVST